jgi:hypothetical protein
MRLVMIQQLMPSLASSATSLISSTKNVYEPARLPLESCLTAFVEIPLRGAWDLGAAGMAIESRRAAAGLKYTAALMHVQGPILAARRRLALRNATGRAIIALQEARRNMNTITESDMDARAEVTSLAQPPYLQCLSPKSTQLD